VGIRESRTSLVLLLSLREMIEEDGEAGPKVASKAIQDAIQAAARYTRAQLLAEELERQAEKKQSGEPPRYNGDQRHSNRRALQRFRPDPSGENPN